MPGAKYYHHAGAGISRAQRRPRRPAWQWTLLAVGVLGAALVALALLPPRVVSPRGPRSAGGLEKKLEMALLDLNRAQPTPGLAPPAVHVTVSDADVSAYLAENSGERPLSLAMRHPQVAFGAGQITATAQVRLIFLPVRMTAEVTPVAHKGQLRVRVDRLRVGLLPVPGRYRRSLALQAQNTVNSGLHASNSRLEALEIMPGQMAVTVRPPP